MRLNFEKNRHNKGVSAQKRAEHTPTIMGDKKIGTKIVVFREKDCLKDMFTLMDVFQKIEATFRMGLKGGIHYFFNDTNVTIGNIYMDFDRNHLEHHDEANMLERVKSETREHIQFKTDSRIIPLPKEEYTLDDIHSEFMQFADVIVGGFRTQLLCMRDFRARYNATTALQSLIKKKWDNPVRMRNSRYENAYTFSDAWIENGEWKFEKMRIISDEDCEQMRLDL